MAPDRGPSRLLLALLLALGIVLGAAPAGAQDAGEPSEEATEFIRGTLINKQGTREQADDEPVEGVEITIAAEDGAEVGVAISDADGIFELALPGPGPYVAVLDTETLPDGVALAEGKNELSFVIDPGQRRVLIFDLGARTRETTSTFDRFLQLTFAGARFGMIIAITAVGLSLIFGTTGLTNFMHGELVTFGAIIAWFINVKGGLHIFAATLIAMVVSGIVGALLDTALWRQLRRRGVSLLAMMVVSIGLSLLLRNLFQLWFGESPRPFAQYSNQRASIELGPVLIAAKDLWSMGIALVAMLAVAFLLQRTRIGKAMRAVSDNPDLAATSGIDVDQVIRFVWALGAALACLGGVLFALNERIGFNSGFNLLLLMFAGITLGGLGTAYGALLGSFIVGMFVNVSTIWIPPELKNVGALAVLIIVLLIRPQGILGRPERVG